MFFRCAVDSKVGFKLSRGFWIGLWLIGLSFSPAVWADKTRVTIGSEISRVRDLLGQPDQNLVSDSEERSELIQYAKLLDLKQRKSLEFRPDVLEPTMNPAFFEQLRQTRLWLNSKLDPDAPRLPVASVFKLFNFIESNRHFWKAQLNLNPPEKVKPVPYKLENLDLTISVNSKGKVLIVDRVDNNGLSKTVELGLRYKRGGDRARLLPKRLLAPKLSRSYETEVKVQTRLLEYYQEQRAKDPNGNFGTGLVETFSANRDEIEQSAYAGNLYNVDPDFFAKFTREDRLQAIEDLTRGLRRLHGLRIVHSDLKEENLLYRFKANSDRLELDYCDFGESLFIDEVDVNQERPRVGNHYYMPPEVFYSKWYGENEDRRTLMLQADVHAHALLSYLILEGDLHPIVKKCEEKTRDSDKFIACREKSIADELTKGQFQVDYRSDRHLFLRSLHPHPVFRPTMDEFLSGVQHLKTKVSDTTTVLPNDILLEMYADLKLQDGQSFDYIAEFRERKASQGQYALVTVKAADGFRIGIVLVGIDAGANPQIEFKHLDVNPADPQAVRAELKFLKAIATLTTPLL